MGQDSLQLRVGTNLKRLIKSKGLTQEKFAELIPVDPTTVRKWLKNGIDKVSTLECISKILNVGVMDILQ